MKYVEAFWIALGTAILILVLAFVCSGGMTAVVHRIN